MDNKYYTPTIEEFHVGFEYERLIDNPNIEGNGWIKCVYPKDPFIGESISRVKNLTNIRVKYLDQEDIENLEWKCIEEYGLSALSDGIFYRTYEFIKTPHKRLTHYGSGEMSTIHMDYLENDNTREWPVLRGCNIKNKSELKTLMKWLRIE